MSNTNAKEKLNDKEKAFKEKYFSDRNIDDEALKKIYEDCKNINDEQEIKAILGLLPPKKEKELITLSDWDEAKDKTADPKNNTGQNKTPTVVDEGRRGTASNEKSEWMNGLLEQYQTAYDANPQTKNQYNINGEPQDDGSYLIAIDPKKEEEGKTGTVAQYYDRNHFAIRTSTKGVEPKDQSFEHFKNHIAVAKENGSDEIVMGNTKSAVFRTKLAAAVLATEGMSLHTPFKGTDSLDFSLETLKEIPVETQGKLLEFALQNGVEIENPILDFNNEAVKNLPEELKYKYLATLLQNEETKGQIKNAPEIEFFAKDENGNKIETERKTIDVKDADGNIVARNDGSPRTIEIINYEPNPALKNLGEEELTTLRTFKREQQIAQIRSDDNNKSKVEMHDKVAALRQQLKGKTGKERKDIINNANVTEQTHGKNFNAYANKYHNQQGRS